MSKPRSPEAREFATQVEQFMDWATDRTQFRFFVEDVIKTALVDQGPVMKRMEPRTMGRANVIRKRTNHITIVLSEE